MSLSGRQQQILKYVETDRRGIEIAPWHSPIAPKKLGYNIKSLDIFDQATLADKCRNDHNISHLTENIETVDFVCSAMDIAETVSKHGENGCYDYIISSHNFEHLPDPISFMRGCGEVLARGGYLSMAIPDKRRTFDYVRAVSRTSDLLRSYFEKKTQPSPYDLYDSAKLLGNIPPLKIEQVKDPHWVYSVDEEFHALSSAIASKLNYEDCHVTVYTPDSFKAIMLELIRLNLIPFQLLEVTATPDLEFYVHMKNVGYGHPSRDEITDDQLLKAYIAGFSDEASLPQMIRKKTGIAKIWTKMKRAWRKAKA